MLIEQETARVFREKRFASRFVQRVADRKARWSAGVVTALSLVEARHQRRAVGNGDEATAGKSEARSKN